MSTENETQRAARDACIGFFNGCSVFLAYGSGGSWASGVVFRAASGAPIILTARHVAETLPDAFRIGNISGADAHAGVATKIVLGPPRPAVLHGDGQEPNTGQNFGWDELVNIAVDLLSG